ncbi:MAG: hypothetical protein A3H91_09885 [Gammaproteobacteria bacterium RIFCSPLOWO2_02_FULL_61_13]|nr:MAG: hypothetical protein A3H91_09885 [Gammaproteobacteria bacterium RIFCSPLOWO2_02_FULL_61_13]
MAHHRASLGRVTCAALLLALSMAGCLGKGGTTTRYYLVDPVAFTAAESAAPPPAVEIMDLHIPQYLERFQIATRTGKNGIVYAEYHQWGESLRKNLLRTMARNLSALLGITDVSTPLNRSLATPAWRIQIHIDQFEQDVDGHVRLKAHWQILDARAPQAVPETHALELESAVAMDKGDFGPMVAAMSELYGQLAEDIAASISTDASADQEP